MALMRSACARARVRASGYLEPEDALAVVVGRIVEIAGDHEQLPELFLEGHAPEQVLDAVGNRKAGIPVGQPFSGRRLTQHGGRQGG